MSQTLQTPGTQIPPKAGNRWTSFGPGAIFALSVVGAGDYVSNAAVGAAYGTALLWTLPIALLCRYVWIESLARYVLVTGETPFTGFARVSRALVWIVLFTLFAHRHIHGLGHVVYMGQAVDMLAPLPMTGSAIAWSLVFVLAGFVTILWGSNKLLEYVFKGLMAFMVLALILVAFLAAPPLSEILHGLFVPSLPDAEGPHSSLLLLTAMLGTEACSLSNVTYAYFMWQKGWRDVRQTARQRQDLIYSIAAVFIIGAFIQIASAGTVRRSGVELNNIEDLVKVFSLQLATVGRLAFGLGIWAAVFTSFVGGIRGYSLAIADLARALKLTRQPEYDDPTGMEDPLARKLAIFFTFSPLYILYTSVRPVGLILAASSTSVLVIPIISFALLRLTSSRTVMGEHRNHWTANVVLAGLGLVACYFIYQNALDLWTQFGPAAG